MRSTPAPRAMSMTIATSAKSSSPAPLTKSTPSGRTANNRLRRSSSSGQGHELRVDVHGVVLLNTQDEVLRVGRRRLICWRWLRCFRREAAGSAGQQHKSDQEYQQDINQRSDVYDRGYFATRRLHRHGNLDTRSLRKFPQADARRGNQFLEFDLDAPLESAAASHSTG